MDCGDEIPVRSRMVRCSAPARAVGNDQAFAVEGMILKVAMHCVLKDSDFSNDVGWSPLRQPRLLFYFDPSSVCCPD